MTTTEPTRPVLTRRYLRPRDLPSLIHAASYLAPFHGLRLPAYAVRLLRRSR